MSMVTVHGPNTMYTTEGGGTSNPSTPAGAQAAKDVNNGLQFNFSFPSPGARPAADFDWTFTGPGSPAAQNDKFSGSVTFTGAGAVTIVCTVAAGAGPPAAGAYTISGIAATAGMPRSLPPGGDGGDGGGEEPPPDEPPVFDPADHTVPEVEDYITTNPDELERVYLAELDGKNRTTLISWLEGQGATAE